MKKIAFLIGNLGVRGGGERVVCSLANSLRYEYQVYIYHFGEEKPFHIEKEVVVRNLVAPTLHPLFRKMQRLLLLDQMLKNDFIDVLIAFGWQSAIYSAIISKKMKIKIISSERNNPIAEPKSILLKKLRTWAYKHSSVVICQSNSAKEYLKCSNTRIIMNPLRKELPEPYLGKRNKVIVNYCRLYKQKNLPLLIEAFKEFHDSFSEYQLEIYGEGELEKSLKRMIEKLGISDCAKILPFDANIHQKISESAMYVSTSDYEGLSNSMLESMALGLPCIVTDCPVYGARMVIKNNINGILVPINNKRALIKSMQYLAENPIFALQISEQAVKIREKLNLECICKLWKTTIEECLLNENGKLEKANNYE